MAEQENGADLLRRHQEHASAAAEALETALCEAELPCLGAPFTASGTREGGYVQLGAAGAHAVQALAAWITAHARCTGGLLDGEVGGRVGAMIRASGASVLAGDGLFIVRRAPGE